MGEIRAARETLRAVLKERDGVDPDDVIMDPGHGAPAAGLTSTVCFPTGNLAPEGSVIKSTAIDPTRGRRRTASTARSGPARVFCTEAAAIAAIKSSGRSASSRAT